MPQSGKIFNPYKSLGYVSNDVPLVARYIRRRKENLIVTSVGHAFHTYGCSHFTLLSISGQHEEEICCLAGDTYHVYTAAGCNVFAWRRGCELTHKYIGHKHKVHCILPFGPHLITVDEESVLRIWDIKTEEVVLEMEFKNDIFQITCIMHPSTYLNKVLLGSEQGSMHLFNINSQCIIYTFNGWGSAVRTMEQSPALHVAGIGLNDGSIILHNLKLDEILMRFHQDWGPVVSLSFRTDAPLMVSGSGNGRIVLWDLENQKVFSQLTNAHSAAVTGLKCLPQEPLMVSSSPDNSLKLWIFDKMDGGARLLRVREGHSAPPSFVRFHGADGHNMLSVGGDSCLRIFNTQTEIFNKSLGRASYKRKSSKRKGLMADDPLIMPPMVGFSSVPTRDKEWNSIAARHLGLPDVTTWSYGNLKMGDFRLSHQRFKKKQSGQSWVKASASCVVITHCGNFVVVGYTSGHADRFNIQSGAHRATYGSPAHKGAVRGVAVDNLNQTVVTGGSDSYLKWWHFSKFSEICVLLLDAAVAFFCHHSETDVLAVALEDYSISLVDVGERTIIRHLPGHAARLTDITFSPDARWLVTAAMDKRIFTWDIPSGCLIDRFEVESACTSIAFSPTGELLASTHVDCLGVSLWFNRTLYTHISLRPLTNEDTPIVSLPTGVHEGKEETDIENEEDEESKEFESRQQIEDLITLSGLPSSRWLNLLNIDIVRRRNQPKGIIKPTTPAPFFLPTIPSLDVRFDLSNVESSKELPIAKDFSTATPFAKLLQATETTNNFDGVIEKLKNMGPSAVNYEIVAILNDDDVSLRQYMLMISTMLTSGKDIELAQSYLGLFLKVHGDTIIQNESLLNMLPDLQKIQGDAWEKLETKFFYTLSVIQALRNI